MRKLLTLLLIAVAAMAYAAPTDSLALRAGAQVLVYAPAPEANTGHAVVVCPGGGYANVSMYNEGRPVGEMLAANGITAIILKYPLPDGSRHIPLVDARQALKYVRQNASRLGIDPAKVGIMGFSAGGHLAATASTHPSSDPEENPNYTILYYPVATFDSRYTHRGTVDNLLGAEHDNHQLLRYYSNELQVTATTPPALLLHSDDDGLVDPMNSVLYYKALKEHEIPAEMVIYPTGGHGWSHSPGYEYQADADARVVAFILRQ